VGPLIQLYLSRTAIPLKPRAPSPTRKPRNVPLPGLAVGRAWDSSALVRGTVWMGPGGQPEGEFQSEVGRSEGLPLIKHVHVARVDWKYCLGISEFAPCGLSGQPLSGSGRKNREFDERPATASNLRARTGAARAAISGTVDIAPDLRSGLQRHGWTRSPCRLSPRSRARRAPLPPTPTLRFS
jgi:hypothetical protein